MRTQNTEIKMYHGGTRYAKEIYQQIQGKIEGVKLNGGFIEITEDYYPYNLGDGLIHADEKKRNLILERKIMLNVNHIIEYFDIRIPDSEL